MGYYHIPLDRDSQDLTSIILPWGRYYYTRLAQGPYLVVDIFQSAMSNIFGNLEWVYCYVDNILVVSNEGFEDYLEKLSTIL